MLGVGQRPAHLLIRSLMLYTHNCGSSNGNIDSGQSQHSRIGRSMVRSAALALVLPWLVAQPEEWPQFRGPTGDGRSSEANLPLTWSERKNIRWKATIPGNGWSSPVIAGADVWLTVATDGNRSLRLLSLDAATG